MASVKLKVYQFESELTYIDTIEAKDFGDFMIVTINFEEQDFESILYHFKDTFPEKKILIIPQGMDVAFYGIKEDDDRPTDS